MSAYKPHESFSITAILKTKHNNVCILGFGLITFVTSTEKGSERVKFSRFDTSCMFQSLA